MNNFEKFHSTKKTYDIVPEHFDVTLADFEQIINKYLIKLEVE